MIVSVVSVVFVPKLMGVSAYGYWQLYLFYMSYAGVLHLGLCDGVYLANGGKYYSDLRRGALKTELLMLALYAALLCIAMFAYSVLAIPDEDKQRVVWFTSIGAFVHVTRTFFFMILQTTNMLKQYSMLVVLDRITFLVLLVVFAFSGNLSFGAIILADIAGRFASLIIACYICRDIVMSEAESLQATWPEFKRDIASGIQLLISGLAGQLIVGIVRYGVEIAWSIETFAELSLALSLINMFLSFVTMMSLVAFPVIKRMNQALLADVYLSVESLVRAIAILFFAIGVFGVWVVGLWLPEYSSSLQYMLILIPVCLFECETSLLASTFLKAARKETTLLAINIGMMTISLLITAFLVFLHVDVIWSAVIIVLILGAKALVLECSTYNLLHINGIRSLLAEYLVVIAYELTVSIFEFPVTLFICAVIAGCYCLASSRKLRAAIAYIGRASKTLEIES